MKSADDVISLLEAFYSSPDAQNPAQSWDNWDGFGVTAIIEGVLRFMEAHPDIEFGSPGPLVHRLEGFSLEFYVPHLVASLKRTPTVQTVWMLNRIINGMKGHPWRASLIDDMRAISQRSNVAPEIRDAALHCLEHQSET
jgi:hypothetical protein